MSEPEITLVAVGSGHETTAPPALWLKCLLEMLPGAQLVELVRRVEEAKAARIARPGPRHYKLVAEPGTLGVKLR